MSKDNKNLAESIVKKHATSEEVKTDDKTKLVRYEVPAIGIELTLITGKSLKNCEEQLVDLVANELDKGNLVLSDSFVENL